MIGSDITYWGALALQPRLRRELQKYLRKTVAKLFHMP